MRAFVTTIEGDDRVRYTIKKALVVKAATSLLIHGDVEVEVIEHTCARCGGPDALETYTVTKELWASTGLEPRGGLLHLRCLEAIIGRKVVVSDLTDARWNSLLKCALEGR